MFGRFLFPWCILFLGACSHWQSIPPDDPNLGPGLLVPGDNAKTVAMTSPHRWDLWAVLENTAPQPIQVVFVAVDGTTKVNCKVELPSNAQVALRIGPEPVTFRFRRLDETAPLPKRPQLRARIRTAELDRAYPDIPRL